MGPLCLWFLDTSQLPPSLLSAHSILLSHVDGPSSLSPSLRPSVFQPIIRPSVPPFLHDLPPSRPSASDPHGDGQTPPPPMNPSFYAILCGVDL